MSPPVGGHHVHRDLTYNYVVPTNRPVQVHDGWSVDLEEREIHPDTTLLERFRDETIFKAVTLLEEYRMPYRFVATDAKTRGMEVGDDRVSCSHSTLPLAIMHIVQEKVMRMKTSKEDTFISRKLYNLAEVTSIIPAVKTGSFNHARSGRVIEATPTGAKTKSDMRDLGFVDCPSLRVIIDTSKGDGTNHISSAVGKAAFLKTRLHARDGCYTAMQTASIIQDAHLKTVSSPDPKYLPSIMGGTGAPGIYGDPRNVFLSVHYYKGGTMDRVYASALAEIRDAVARMDSGIDPTRLIISTMLRMKSDYLHGTYREQIAVPEFSKVKLREEIGVELYKAVPPLSGLLSVESRLIQSKVLVTRNQAEVEVQKTIKNSQILFGMIPRTEMDRLSRLSRREQSKVFNHALMANTAFASLLNREATGEEIEILAKQGFLISSFGKRRFTLLNAEDITGGIKGDTYNAMDIYSPQDMFLRTDVSTEESLKVGGIPLLQIGRDKKYREIMTTSRVGLYQITGSKLEWSNRLCERLEEERAIIQPIPLTALKKLYYENREWVNDDGLLVAAANDAIVEMLANPSDYLILIGTDRNCARRIADSTNHAVMTIKPKDMARILPLKHPERYDKELKPSDILKLTGFRGTSRLRLPIRILLDTGSERSHASHMEREKFGPLYYRSSKSSTYVRGHRVEYYTLTRIEGGERLPYEFVFPLNRAKTPTIYKGLPGSDYSSRPGSVISRDSDMGESHLESLLRGLPNSGNSSDD